jgi:hypothetical protein
MRYKIALGVLGVNLLSGVLLGARAQSLPQTASSTPVINQTKEATRPATGAPTPVSVEKEVWRKTLVKIPVPAKGCFTANYPALQWVAVPCVTVPLKGPASPRHYQGPAMVGNFIDYSAESPKGVISVAEGSFPTVITSGEINRSITGVYSRKSQFSLQLNTNFFSTPMCDNAPSGPSGCVGWEQFVLTNDPGSPPGFLWIQFWLLYYGTPCPSGWGQSGSDCFYNSLGSGFPVLNIQDLTNISMTARAEENGTDSVLLLSTSPTGKGYAHNSDSQLSLAAEWRIAEFNVFGDLTYHEAVFDPGTLIEVRVAADFVDRLTGGVGDIYPVPELITFTGETNNLNLVEPACVERPIYAILFNESNIAGAKPAICPDTCAFFDNKLPPNGICPVLPPTQGTRPTICQELAEAVAADRKVIANEVAALDTKICEGITRFECMQTIKRETQKLQQDEAEKTKYCP